MSRLEELVARIDSDIDAKKMSPEEAVEYLDELGEAIEVRRDALREDLRRKEAG